MSYEWKIWKYHDVDMHEVIYHRLIPSNSWDLEIKVANSRPLTVVLNAQEKRRLKDKSTASDFLRNHFVQYHEMDKNKLK